MLGTANRDRSAERREATRREILDAAWSLAREHGLAQLTLRGVAELVGMRAPSLYSHFESKSAIYDAMFGESWAALIASYRAAEHDTDDPDDLRGELKRFGRMFFDFSVADLARYQLMNQRTIPGFEPTPEAYAPAVECLDLLREFLSRHGIDRSEDVDLYTALLGGLVNAQLANDPGGDRWARLLDRAIDMYVNDLPVTRGEDHR